MLCKELNNFFEIEKHFGTFTISEGSISLDFLQENQYFRIVGSVFNDGVYKYGDTLELTDETFSDGAIWSMAVPKQVVALSEEIEQWTQDNSTLLSSPYQSESFGGYSYSLKVGNSASGDSSLTWQSHFANKLNPWRKAKCRY